MSIENNFNVVFIAALALREKQIQQNYRPIIAVHKWFARRPGALFRGLALAEFTSGPVEDSYFRSNAFPGRKVADPFMGGGTPLIEANRLGCDVEGYDINPMAAWIVREEIEHLNLPAYRAAAGRLTAKLKKEIGHLYLTDCPLFGDKDVPVKSFLWVKTLDCEKCNKKFDLFPGYLLAEDRRHPLNVLVCSKCGDLNEVESRKNPGKCHSCRVQLAEDGPARRNRCACPRCGHENSYPRGEAGPPRHRLFAIEYYNPARKAGHKGRFFKKPDAVDLARAEAARAQWKKLRTKFVPDQEILPGDETDRLHRWGYSHYRDLFNDRQLLGLELSCRLIAKERNERVRYALATNLSDLLRYQNMLCRYDTMALKSLDIFSIHGFPVGLVQCESNIIGITNDNSMNVGSGGWSNIIDKYTKAKAYCDAPFEVRREGNRKIQVSISGEWIGEKMNGAKPRKVKIRCRSSTAANLPPQSLDAVFTDPPYFGNVQYGELMDFCYVWLRKLVGKEVEGFERELSRSVEELTGNVTQARGLEHFTDGLSAVYRKMAPALKPGAPLAFTYHHNKLDAYYAIGVAILDAGLTCSASIPCPAEMGGSIHIHGTSSSIIDTVFVCRTAGATPQKWLYETPAQLAAIVAGGLAELKAAGVPPRKGDIHCTIYGHLTRMAIWNLRGSWKAGLPTREKLDLFADAVSRLADPVHVIGLVEKTPPKARPAGTLFAAQARQEEAESAVSF